MGAEPDPGDAGKRDDGDGGRPHEIARGRKADTPGEDEQEPVEQHGPDHMPARETHEVVELGSSLEPVEVEPREVGAGAADSSADERVHAAGKWECHHHGRFEPAAENEEGAKDHGPERDRPEAAGQVRNKAHDLFETRRVEPADCPHQGVVEFAPFPEGCVSQ